MSVGWIIVSVFTMFVGLGMAEITSAHPTSGGPYFWAAMLAPNERYAAFFSWITGWSTNDRVRSRKTDIVCRMVQFSGARSVFSRGGALPVD